MQVSGQPRQFFASALSLALFALGAFGFLVNGVLFLWEGGWKIAGGLFFLSSVPFWVWQFWNHWRIPFIEINGNSLILRNPMNPKKLDRVPLAELGALKWRNFATFCFEHRSKGEFTIWIGPFSRKQREALLEELTGLRPRCNGMEPSPNGS